MGEFCTVATIYGYMSSWAISDSHVTNTKIIAGMERYYLRHQHKSNMIYNHLKFIF